MQDRPEGETRDEMDASRPDERARPRAQGTAALEELEQAGLLPPGIVLGNEEHGLFLTRDGAGVSAHRQWILTAWRGDPMEPDGLFFHLLDPERGTSWTATPRPGGAAGAGDSAGPDGEGYRIRRERAGIESLLQVRVPEGEPLELRRLTLNNLSRDARTIEVTSYAEVVLHAAAAQAGHPAFARLFVRSAFHPKQRALLFHRRPRGEGEIFPVLGHALLDGEVLEFDTDRARVLGRGRSVRAPRAMAAGARLSGSTGNVLDPVCALRTGMRLEPGASASWTFFLSAAADEGRLLERITAWSDPGRIRAAFREPADGAVR